MIIRMSQEQINHLEQDIRELMLSYERKYNGQDYIFCAFCKERISVGLYNTKTIDHKIYCTGRMTLNALYNAEEE